MIEILSQTRICTCALCEEGRFIKRLQALLPEAESTQLGQWYCALLDATCDKDMDFYWIDLKLKEVQAMVADFTKKRSAA